MYVGYYVCRVLWLCIIMFEKNKQTCINLKLFLFRCMCIIMHLSLDPFLEAGTMYKHMHMHM